MVETIKLKEKKKNMKEIKENAETRMAVYIYIYIVYCHLENKIRKSNSSKNKGRTMPVKQAIGLPLCAFTEKVEHNHRRGGP